MTTSVAKKNRFIELRAEGQSYDKIAAEVGISKATCSALEQELKAEVAARKASVLEELYERYSMTRAARIRRLGETIARLDAAIDQVDFSKVAPEKLLALRLKYHQALAEEYLPAAGAVDGLNGGPRSSMYFAQLDGLMAAAVAGELPPERARGALRFYDEMVKEYAHAEQIAHVEWLRGLTSSKTVEVEDED